jgi:hypothetical protein
MPASGVVGALRHEDLYHTGIVVRDLDAAKGELHATLGVAWRDPIRYELPVLLEDGTRNVDFHAVYSVEGPHYLELVQAIEDTLWSTSGPGQAHHLGYWTDDVAGTSRALERAGAPRVAAIGTDTPEQPGFAAYHRGPSGLYVEVVDIVGREWLLGAPDERGTVT